MEKCKEDAAVQGIRRLEVVTTKTVQILDERIGTGRVWRRSDLLREPSPCEISVACGPNKRVRDNRCRVWSRNDLSVELRATLAWSRDANIARAAQLSLKNQGERVRIQAEKLRTSHEILAPGSLGIRIALARGNAGDNHQFIAQRVAVTSRDISNL